MKKLNPHYEIYDMHIYYTLRVVNKNSVSASYDRFFLRTLRTYYILYKLLPKVRVSRVLFSLIQQQHRNNLA